MDRFFNIDVLMESTFCDSGCSLAWSDVHESDVDGIFKSVFGDQHFIKMTIEFSYAIDNDYSVKDNDPKDHTGD